MLRRKNKKQLKQRAENVNFHKEPIEVDSKDYELQKEQKIYKLEENKRQEKEIEERERRRRLLKYGDLKPGEIIHHDKDDYVQRFPPPTATTSNYGPNSTSQNFMEMTPCKDNEDGSRNENTIERFQRN